jgi:hypothetical protein
MPHTLDACWGAADTIHDFAAILDRPFHRF